MFLLLKVCVGPFVRQWSIPAALTPQLASPALGQPILISVVPGTYSTVVPGSVNFPVPNYNSLTATIRGAGGGGSSDQVQTPGTDGQGSHFNVATQLVATGGLVGVGPPPADQGGSGGAVTVGGGGAGGLGFDVSANSASTFYAGSAGGRVTKTWNRLDAGAPVPGSMVMLFIGAGGTGATTTRSPASPGVNGRADINWS